MPQAFFVKTNTYVEGRVNLVHEEGFYKYDEKSMSYSKNGKTVLRYGDIVRVKCISASKERRQVDFALVKKAS